MNIKTGSSSLAFTDYGTYNFQAPNENRTRGFVHPDAILNSTKFPLDLNGVSRNTTSVTIGAFEN